MSTRAALRDRRGSLGATLRSGWASIRRALASAFRRPKRDVPLALAVVGACVASAAVTSNSVADDWAAQATMVLTTDVSRDDLVTVLEQRKRRIAVARGDDASAVTVTARPGDPSVRVVAHREERAAAIDAANQYTVTLTALDRGVNRELVARRVRRLERAIARVAVTPQERKRDRLSRQLAQLLDRQVTDADFAPARRAERVAGPTPLADAALALPVGIVIAAAMLLGLQALDRRRPAQVG